MSGNSISGDISIESESRSKARVSRYFGRDGTPSLCHIGLPARCHGGVVTVVTAATRFFNASIRRCGPPWPSVISHPTCARGIIVKETCIRSWL